MDDSDEEGKVKEKVQRRRGHGGQMWSRSIPLLFC